MGDVTVPRTAEPSWARVLATTVRLSAARRRHLAVLILILAVALAAVTVLHFTGALAGTAAPARTAPDRTPAPDAAAAARSRAAAWIVGQVSANAIIACHPDMCAALQVQGVSAARLMPLRTATASPAGAAVLVTSPSAPSQVAAEYTPALVASFRAGDARIDVLAAEPGGAAAYPAALRADLAARRSAGSQLLRNPRLAFAAADAARVRAGEVDSRLLATLATLTSLHAFRVIAFGDASPGAAVLFREVTLTSTGAVGLMAAAALARAQAPPFLPAHVATVGLAAGQTALIIEFAAPSPLGLLTAVLR